MITQSLQDADLQPDTVPAGQIVPAAAVAEVLPAHHPQSRAGGSTDPVQSLRGTTGSQQTLGNSQAIRARASALLFKGHEGIHVTALIGNCLSSPDQAVTTGLPRPVTCPI